jgi:carbonic anhydrase
MKSGVTALDDAAVLAKVAALPVTEWSYSSEHGVRHVGPMAQDFYAAFRVGEDDRHITSIDEDGVALAAIKALYAENARTQAENSKTQAVNAKMQADNASLHSENAALRDRLAALEKKVAALADQSSKK